MPNSEQGGMQPHEDELVLHETQALKEASMWIAIANGRSLYRLDNTVYSVVATEDRDSFYEITSNEDRFKLWQDTVQQMVEGNFGQYVENSNLPESITGLDNVVRRTTTVYALRMGMAVFTRVNGDRVDMIGIDREGKRKVIKTVRHKPSEMREIWFKTYVSLNPYFGGGEDLGID